MKYRIWDKKAKEFMVMDMRALLHLGSGELLVGNSVQIAGTRASVCYDIYAPESPRAKELVLERSIDQKDSTGKEIFEGDILQYTVGDQLYTVEWASDKSAFIGICYIMGYRIDGLKSYPLSGSGMTVIGNIHQNADKLNPKNYE